MTDAADTPFDRLAANWVYGGVLSGLLLLAIAPLVIESWPRAAAATYLALPVYMAHQYEEHDADRFRRFVNRLLGDGYRGLTLADVLVVNVVFVWFLLAAVLWLTLRVAEPWALVAAYLLLINAVVHVVQAFVFRQYNPGLGTACVLFLPLGALLIAAVPTASLAHHLGAALLIVALHAGILVRARRPKARP